MTQPPEKTKVDVAIGIVLQIPPNPPLILISQRLENAVLADFWEFPGGKIEPGESAEQAVIRELREELDIQVRPIARLPVLRHQYPYAMVALHPLICRIVAGKCRNIGVRQHLWIPVSDIAQYRFPPANQPLFAILETWINQSSLLGSDNDELA